VSLVLTPTAEAGLPTLRVDDVLFPVGRDEAGFRELPDVYRGRLDTRHARIFEDRGIYYVVGLGGAQGTRVNGEPVTVAPVALAAGDTLTFGEDLVYTVSFDAAEGDTSPSPTARPGLLLVPLDDGPDPAAIAIGEFPFLIGKNQPALATWGQRQPEAFGFLSRRHAQISRDGDGFLIEDLSSTNGTWVNGRRERDTTRSLGPGDRVSFGQEHHGFRVELCHPGAREALPQGTILVSKAASFLDIYCESGPASVATDPGPAKEPGGATTGPGWLTQQLRRPWSLQRTGIVAAVVAAIALGLVLQLLRDDRPDRVRALLDQQDHAAAAALAEAYLVEDPGHGGVRRDLAAALEGLVLPDWLAAYDAGDRSAAAALVAAAQQRAVAGGRDWLDLLRWLGDASLFAAETDGLARYVLYRDETRLSALVEDPARPASPPPPALAALIRRHPDLGAVYREGVSRLRRMRDDAATYVPAIEALDRDLRSAIDAGAFAAVGDILDDFADRYPRLDGVDLLRQDLDRFSAWAAVLEAQDVVRFAALQAGSTPLTPPFRDAWRQRSDALGEMAPRVEAWRAAAAAWRDGELARADAALAKLDPDGWGRSAGRERDRWFTLLTEFEALQSESEQHAASSASAARLSALFLALDAGDDTWLRQRVEALLATRRPALRTLADEHLVRAEAAWQDYSVAQGGIDSGLRLEPRVSDAFRDRARTLQAAHRNAYLLVGLDYFLDEPQRLRADSLYRNVTAEIARQRQALENLADLLDRSVIEEKLALIPALEA
jgi:pSer/pThr/pTyr-binding forkhead associated (FHA) protein